MILRDYLIAMLIGVIFITATMGILASFSADYSISSDNLSNYSQLDSIVSNSSSFITEISEENINPVSFWGLVTAPWKIIKIVIGSISLFNKMIGAFFSEYTFIPSWLGTVIISAFEIIFVFLVISLVFRRKA